MLFFLGQFTIRCIYHFQEGVDNFEIEHKTCYFLGRRCSTPCKFMAVSKMECEFVFLHLILLYPWPVNILYFLAILKCQPVFVLPGMMTTDLTGMILI